MNFPEEIIEMVLCHLSGKDLMQLCLAGKSFSNVLLFPKPWKEACLRDFDAEFFEDTDWILFYRKQAKIRRNVLDKRFLVQVLCASPSRDNSRSLTSLSAKGQYVVVNWLVTSEGFEYNDGSEIMDLKTRKVEELSDYEELRYYGDYRVYVSQWHPLGALSMQFKQLHGSLWIDGAWSIVGNDDPMKRHLIAILDFNNGNLDQFKVVIYDLRLEKQIKELHADIPEADRDVSWSAAGLILHGDKVLLTYKTYLHTADITAESSSFEVQSIPLQKKQHSQPFVHKSTLFYSSEMEFQMLNLRTKQSRTIDDFITCTRLDCGLFLMTTANEIQFVEADCEKNELKIVSNLDIPNLAYVRLLSSGSFVCAGYGSPTVRLIDWEHGSEECEVLLVEPAHQNREEFAKVEMKAYELNINVQELLGEKYYTSRYFDINEERRFGIIYLHEARDKGVAPINTNVVASLCSEYNTPYLNLPGAIELELEVPEVLRGPVIFFYEEWVDEGWRLSKPYQWDTMLDDVLLPLGTF